MIDTIDRATLDEAAREALTRPESFGTTDDRLYNTHGCVMSWADRDSSDALPESNFYAMLALLEGAVAHDESGASEVRGDDVLDLSMSHWGYGRVRELFVRVYVDDNQTDYTPAFVEAVRASRYLRYVSPILDQSDFYDREYAAWKTAVDGAISYTARDYDHDSLADEQAIYHLLTRRDGDVDPIDDFGYPEPDWDRVAELYASMRDLHFGWLAERAYRAQFAPPAPGQLPLF